MEITHKIFNNEVYERHKLDHFLITLHMFTDNSLEQSYLNSWLETEKAQWIRKYVKELEYESYKDYSSLQLHVIVTGFITAKRWTEFLLKFS